MAAIFHRATGPCATTPAEATAPTTTERGVVAAKPRAAGSAGSGTANASGSIASARAGASGCATGPRPTRILAGRAVTAVQKGSLRLAGQHRQGAQGKVSNPSHGSHVA